MRLAVLADIHSNHYALEACVSWMKQQNIDGIIFAGDYVSDCPYPQETMRLIRQLRESYQTWFVRGNREEIMLKGSQGDVKWNCHQGSLAYTCDNLTQHDIEFFQSLPMTQVIEFEGYPPVSVSHGDLHNSRGQVRPGNDCMAKLLEEMKTTLHICGHSHHPFIYEADHKIVLNPGSVGVPVSGFPQAEMAVIESDGQCWKPSLLRLDYDIESAIREFQTSGLSDVSGVWGRCIIALLQTGRHYCEECMKRIQILAKETGRDPSDPVLWQQAADELGV